MFSRLVLEASIGFEPMNNGFADRPLKPLGQLLMVWYFIILLLKAPLDLHSVHHKHHIPMLGAGSLDNKACADGETRTLTP